MHSNLSYPCRTTRVGPFTALQRASVSTRLKKVVTQMALARMFEPITKWLTTWHRNRVGAELRKYGLRLEDLYDPEGDADVAEALRRLPKEVTDARLQRLKRASDLSMKHEYLSEEMQAKQTPFKSYLKVMLDQVEKENRERRSLGFTPKAQRTIP